MIMSGLKRISRQLNEPYIRLSEYYGKRKAFKRWCIRIKPGFELGYPKYLVDQAGINLKGKRIIYKKEYDWINPPTLDDIEIVSNSEFFKSIYIHNLPPEIKETIHSIIELSKKINYELRNHIS